MNSLDEVKPVAEKPKRVRKPKAQPVLEPVVEPLPEPEPGQEPVQEPEPSPKSEPEAEAVPFTEAEMDIYRRVNAHKRKLLRLKKSAVTFAEV